jgi:hypothetical protein
MVPSPAKVQERGAVRTASPPHRTDWPWLIIVVQLTTCRLLQ